MNTLYKLDSKGKIRVWRMEVEGNKFRTISGLQEGKQTTTAWTITTPKNIGRANATTAEEQAVEEAAANYKKKLSGEYKESIDDVGKLTFFKPMLATHWEDRKDKIQYEYPTYFQPKLDGVRCIVTKDGAKTRAGKPITSIPHILEELAKVFEKHPDAIFDGELYNHKLKEDFNEIISIVRKAKSTPESIEKSKETVQYHVYDLPSNQEDKFGDRYQYTIDLLNSFAIDYETIVLVPTEKIDSEDSVNTAYSKYVGQGYEGGMIRLDEPYEQKRSKTLMKMKDFEDAEFTIVSVEAGLGNWSGYAKRIVFKLEDGRICGAGLKGNQNYARVLLEEAEEYIGGEVTIKFFTRTPDGVPRFPVAIALYKHKREL